MSSDPLPVRKPNFRALPKEPVAGSPWAYQGGHIGLIDEFAPSGMEVPAYPFDSFSSRERRLTRRFIREIDSVYHRFYRDRLLFLNRKAEIDRLYSDDVFTHARKHAKNDLRLIETIQKMMILESEPKDWIKTDLDSFYPMPHCVWFFIESLSE